MKSPHSSAHNLNFNTQPSFVQLSGGGGNEAFSSSSIEAATTSSTCDIEAGMSQDTDPDGNYYRLHASSESDQSNGNKINMPVVPDFEYDTTFSDESEQEDEPDPIVPIKIAIGKDGENPLSFLDKFNKDYDGQVDKIADKATWLISNGSFHDCGLYQFISFLFISIAWSVGNGWYAYVSVFSGYTPPFECDTQHMFNATTSLSDSKCSAVDLFTNETIKCTKWKYDNSQLLSTIITEFDLVCEKDYYFELAYSLEQIGYIIGTLIFSYIADKIGRKPVLVGVIFSMSILGILQYFVLDFIVYFVIGFLLNSLACVSKINFQLN